MYVVLWSVYLSGTACGLVWSGLVLPSQFGCGRRGATLLPEACCHVCMYVCMYGQQVQRSYIVVLFWRPDLTLL